VGPDLDDYEPVSDDNPEHNAHADRQDGLSEENVTNVEEEEEGEELFGDNFMRYFATIKGGQGNSAAVRGNYCLASLHRPQTRTRTDG
jgi:hypothetical protein